MKELLGLTLFILLGLIALVLSWVIIKHILQWICITVMYFKGIYDESKEIKDIRKRVLGDSYTAEQKEAFDSAVQHYQQKGLPIIDRLLIGQYHQNLENLKNTKHI